MAEYMTVNSCRDAKNCFVAVKNRAVNLKSVTIKWKGQLTQLFSKTERGKKQNENMVVLVWTAQARTSSDNCDDVINYTDFYLNYVMLLE